MSIGRDVVQRGFMLGRKNDHTKPYLLYVGLVLILSRYRISFLAVFLFKSGCENWKALLQLLDLSEVKCELQMCLTVEGWLKQLWHSLLYIYYSCLRQSTGFFVAADQVCQLTVNNEIIIVISPATINIHKFR